MVDNELVETVSSQVGEFQTVGNLLTTSTELRRHVFSFQVKARHVMHIAAFALDGHNLLAWTI